MTLGLQGEFTFLHALLSFVVGTIAVLFFRLFLRSRQHLVELAPEFVFVPRGYTLDELSEYDGVKKPLAFVSVRGVIYSCSTEMYGLNAPYNAFAGRDSSRHLGKVKVGREESNADWTTLSESHLAALKDWEELLRSKYVAVGWIIPSEDFTKRAEAFEP
ncbi:membrane-associated progesterone binding protein 2 [Trypanosoma conorhini]|uniref:Membrane-associated progesterone binding protein 2 n=1 Tax=Trypanosoma conorhini TaxID=83891 RepID=A0A3S5IST7_9TRYP|nr:membrane-associated progesterone binding protein 2 [Trypanosoma conorhini]RNF13299.1 membrane-associated progesterone binding protein 2 [Trypanosoma conorhini]